ncbi:MAG: hypothetical protein DRI99_05070 [Candidatus Aminicenantes bacterium]|nr:MAG: hypothetical protein DRI99_05070 [Candidatus Aminicenantes bacterium]
MRVGIIGVGSQAKNVHLPTLNSMEEVEIVGIADINEERVKDISKQYEILNAYTDYRDLLNNDNIDLVLICTPSYLHKKMVVESASAGKHVLVEKPMATTVKDADEMINAAKENDIKLCVVQNYRFFPSVKDTKARIKKGRIGEIISMHAYMLDFPPLGAGYSEWRIEGKDSAGVIEDIGPHLIDIVLHLNDSKIEQIYATGGCIGNLDLIDHAQIMIEFEDKSLATLDLSWMAGAKEIALYIQGTGGLLRCDVRNNHVQEIHQYNTPLDDLSSIIRKMRGIVRDVMTGDYFVGPKKFHKEIIRNFIVSIENNTKSPVTGEEGRKTAVVIESALKSIRNREPVFIQR